jgi:hypothetical protein
MRQPDAVVMLHVGEKEIVHDPAGGMLDAVAMLGDDQLELVGNAVPVHIHDLAKDRFLLPCPHKSLQAIELG